LEDIVIRNQEVGSGTGVFVGALWILRIADGRLRIVFSTGDSGRMVWSTPDNPPPGAGDYFQTVHLSYGPAVGMPGTILVTTEYEVSSGRLTLARQYRWSEKWQVFLPTPPDRITLPGGR
jgi:hypothetical protein